MSTWTLGFNAASQLLAIVHVLLFFFRNGLGVRLDFIAAILVAIVIFASNIFYLENDIDLAFRGFGKLIIILSFCYTLYWSLAKLDDKGWEIIRRTLWLSLALSVIQLKGFDLGFMPQMLCILFIFNVEFILNLQGRRPAPLYISAIIMLFSMKKQIIASALMLVGLTRPIRSFFIGTGAIFAILFAPHVWLFFSPNSANFMDGRRSSFLSERFITVDPYGNMRLFLLAEYGGEVVDKSIIFGFGLEKFGSIPAFETNRDIERNILGMNDFVAEKYNTNTVFGSVSADVGILIIWMQMGLLGFLFYYLLIKSVAGKNFRTFLVIATIAPFLIAGANVISVGLSILVSLTAMSLETGFGKTVQKKREVQHHANIARP
ncbi:hypothetical protein H9N28_10040 [Rhodobacter capsulatus]|uniref:hypothetical protein n=1 Tax=Rhodobacter capsulatus TaxID=1061 RepID=UPI0006DCA1E9|nr:hypothetical protein [Rhodobacter capsulatus]KQB12556.1 hypothetical protein AP071_07145 [Rhodobacter capsulatus]KQB16710.1 hypothetical protein AP073_10470 [Rhodobacter capsulatus]PZX26466.1 hypothetical protein LY44_01162 [Rhodobacter capsulatus]QNR61952.1 hypothetical protein H9N28_10040 [Rhodobacter capsulatus]